MKREKKTDREKTGTGDSKEKRMYAGFREYVAIASGSMTTVLLGKYFALDYLHKIGLFMGRDLPDSVLCAMLFSAALIICYIIFDEFEFEPEEGGFTLLKDLGYFLIAAFFTAVYTGLFLVFIGMFSFTKGVLSHYGVGF